MWRTEGQLSATLAVQGCMNFSQQKEVLNGLIQVNDDEERKGGKAESVVVSYRYLELSNPGLQIIESS